MKQIIIKRVVWFAFCATLFSFATIGGESYTIQLNDEIVAQYYVASKAAVPSFSLDRSGVNDELSVFYSECGKIGKQRSLIIKDEKDTVLKEWSFVNVSDEHSPMTCKAKDIIALKQKGSNKLRLYYKSQAVSSGRLMATITLADDLKARN